MSSWCDIPINISNIRHTVLVKTKYFSALSEQNRVGPKCTNRSPFADVSDSNNYFTDFNTFTNTNYIITRTQNSQKIPLELNHHRVLLFWKVISKCEIHMNSLFILLELILPYVASDFMDQFKRRRMHVCLNSEIKILFQDD